MSAPGRPDETEIAPWAKAYVELVEGDDIVEILNRQTPEVFGLLQSLDGEYAFEPAKWTVKEIAGHMSDTERIFNYRLLCIARGDRTPLPGFEQDDYMKTAGFAGRSYEDIVGEFEAVREATNRLVRSLPHDAWDRRGTVSGASVTPRGLAFVIAGHERHHGRILREKYRKA